MESLEIWLIKSWRELEQDVATKGISDVELWNYLTSIAPDLRYDSPTALMEFNCKCEEIIEICSEEQKAKLQSIFFVPFKQSLVEFNFDIPANYWQIDHDNLWAAVGSALSPSTVRELALDAQNMKIEDYREYFSGPYYFGSISEPAKYIDSFDNFREYADSWLSCIQHANDNDSGIIILWR